MAKKDKVKIDKINIKIGDQEIPMTLAQAKELQELLNDTFGLDKVYRPGYPIYIERHPRPWRYYRPSYPMWDTIITCENTGSSVTFSLNANAVSY